MLGYWSLVMLGALDLDGQGHGPEFGHDGQHLGHELGEGHHVGDGHDHGDLVPDEGVFSSLLSFVGLGRVPFAVWLSLLLFGGWSTSLIGLALANSMASLLQGALEWPVRSGLFAGSLLVAVGAARLLSTPLAPLFRVEHGTSRADVVGQECRLVTGRVDKGFGQADLYVGGSALRVEVRCDRDNALKSGDRALVAYYDDTRKAYIIEPLLARREAAHSHQIQEQNHDVR